MIGFAAERLMELEVGTKTGAEYSEKSSEKSSERLAHRNGYRDRDLQTRAGSVEMRLPAFEGAQERDLLHATEDEGRQDCAAAECFAASRTKTRHS